MGGTKQWRGRRQGPLGGALPGLVVVSLMASGVGDARAGEGYALAGVGGSADGLHGFTGVIYAPAGSLSGGGPLLRAWAKSFEFSYETDLPDRPNVRIKALGYGAQVEAGWQIAGRWGRAALIPGLAWRNHKLTPSDPGSRLERDRIGLSITADGEWRFSDRFGIMANASFVTAVDEYWTQARPFVHLGGGWKVGLDLAGHGGPDYAIVRAGAFTTGYELPFDTFGRLFVGGEAGVQSDLEGHRVSPYAGVHVGVLF